MKEREGFRPFGPGLVLVIAKPPSNYIVSPIPTLSRLTPSLSGGSSQGSFSSITTLAINVELDCSSTPTSSLRNPSTCLHPSEAFNLGCVFYDKLPRIAVAFVTSRLLCICGCWKPAERCWLMVVCQRNHERIRLALSCSVSNLVICFRNFLYLRHPGI